MYLYPENLKAKATLWFWSLPDLVLLGIFLAFSLLFFSAFHQPFFVMGSVLFAILTIRVKEESILDFIKAACLYFFTQQFFVWKAR